MSTDRRTALKYIVLLLLVILAGSFWLAIDGKEVPEFLRVIAVSLAIALAALLSQESREEYKKSLPEKTP